MEQKIIDYIKSEYQPEAILLGGSRMKGTATEKSDWDLFLIGSKKENGGFLEFEGQRLDVTLKSWPDENSPLTIPTGPLWPIRVLSDSSQGKLEKVLRTTEEYFRKGPMILYKDKVLGRLQKLDSWKRKIEKYADTPMVEFVYAGVFYEIAIQVWLELQNTWSLAPVEALSIIQEKNQGFYDSLNSFMSSSSLERFKHAETILNALEMLRNNTLK